MTSQPKSRTRTKLAACAVIAFAGALAASNAFASQHITTNACTVMTPTINGTNNVATCLFPLPVQPVGVNGRLFVHRPSSTVSSWHTFWLSNDLSDLWVVNWQSGQINSWCPGAQIKRTCATSSGGANSQVFSAGFRTFTYTPGSGSNNIESQFCPSNKPFLIKAQADTSAWW